jgi:glyoxylase-like metal-dependent hydrolase (beta-lactamase superfamily II)
MPRAVRVSAFLCLLTITVPSVAAQAQQPPAPPPTESEASYRRARAVLDAAAKVLFADKAAPGMDAVSFQINGKLMHRNQSPRSDGPPVGTPYSGELAVDFKRSHAAFERTSSYPGGFDFSNRWVRAGEDSFNYDLLRKLRYTVPRQNMAGFIEAVVLRRLPQHHVQTAQERADTLRWVGEADYNGAKHNIISYASAGGDVISLYFDAQTHLLSKFESLATDALFGDVVVETAFPGYTTVGGIPLPTGQVDKRGGVLTLEVTFTGHSLGLIPDSFAPLPFPPAQQSPSAQPAVRELAKDVYLIEGLGGGGYRVLFVAFQDFVVAIEAPVNDQAASVAIRLIKETVPGKPIRFVVPTHHHDDHAGGIRAFVAEGATILTTPGNANYFVSVVYRARFSIRPDSLARAGRRFTSSSQFLDAAIEGKAVIENGGKRVEIIDIGPGPHAQEMLVAWLPNEKILFQGDLLNRPPDGELRPANDTTAHFYEWLQKSGLPVQQVVGVHSQPTTMAEFATVMEMRRQRASQ